jgi:hypothetical protein
MNDRWTSEAAGHVALAPKAAEGRLEPAAVGQSAAINCRSRHFRFGSARSIRISRKPPFAVDKFQRKLNGCCGTEVKTFRSVGGRPWNVECPSNT